MGKILKMFAPEIYVGILFYTTTGFWEMISSGSWWAPPGNWFLWVAIWFRIVLIFNYLEIEKKWPIFSKGV